jgi:DNA-binding transcriptional LysR family regulator
MYNITLLQMETFLTVAEHLNFSDAAKVMYLTQPSLSQTISRLEEGLEHKLFLRKKYGVELTKEGEYLYSELRPMYHKLCRALKNLNYLESSSRSVLRIACHSSHFSSNSHLYFDSILRDFKLKYPDVTVSEELFEFKELRQILLYGDADIIYTASFVFEDMPDISQKKVFRHQFYIAMSDAHPLAAEDTLQIEPLNNEVFYFVASNDFHKSGNSDIHRCRQIGFTPKEIRYLPNFPSVMMVVKNGDGMALSGVDSYGAIGNGIKYFPVQELPDSPFMTVSWRTDELSETARNFIDMIPDICT